MVLLCHGLLRGPSLEALSHKLWLLQLLLLRHVLNLLLLRHVLNLPLLGLLRLWLVEEVDWQLL